MVAADPIVLSFDALYERAAALFGQGRFAEALEPLQRAAELQPHHPALHLAIGGIHAQQRQFVPAAARFRIAVDLAPQWAEAHCNLGAALLDAGRLGEAEESLRTAARLAPALADAHYNLGLLLAEQGRLCEAEECYRTVLSLVPTHARAHSNLGLVLQYQSNLQEARQCYEKALELQPSLAEARQNLAFLRLMTNQFAEGWESRQWLNRKVFRPRRFLEPVWKGEPLAGKTILLHSEQGLGDFIQFIRYAALVKKRGPASVVVLCEPALQRLLAGCPGIDRLVTSEAALPHFDVHSTLVDLPIVCETDAAGVPASVPYLRVPRPSRRFDTFAAGVAWHGSPHNPGNAARSFPLDAMAPLARVPGVRLYSLQKGAGAEQLGQSAVPVAALGDAVETLDGTAAVIAGLDLVIACDSAIAHLAGALGRPVWVALCAAPDWRWYDRGATTPWYPTMRLYRQQTPDDWAAVFAQMAADLEEAAACR